MKRLTLAIALALGLGLDAAVATKPDMAIQNTDSITCVITGTVIDRPESTMAYIIEANKDQRIHQPYRAPIIDGKFTLTLEDDKPLVYDVFFDDENKRGSWRIRTFYSGNGDVELIIHSNEKADQDEVISPLHDNVLANQFSEIKNARFKAELDSLYAVSEFLFKSKAAFTPEYESLLDRISETKGAEQDSIRNMIYAYNSGPKEKRYSKEYLECEFEIESIYSQQDSLLRQFITENPSLFGLYSIKYAFALLKSRMDWLDIPAYIDIFNNQYKDLFPDHPYTAEIQGMFDALQIEPGNKYPDYKVSREDGSNERMASLIKGNVAVIDLWASWCGPCRRHSKELIPVYEKYKDRGFKVIAVARESENCYAMNYAMKQDGYPWESFVDLNDQDKVWQKNQAGNGGGKIILVNSDGVIVGTDIPTEEIKAFLVKTYGD